MRRELLSGLRAATMTCALFAAGPVLAGGSGMPWEGPLQQIVESVTGPVVLIALSGEKAVEKVRTINGATNPANASAGTIRHDYAPNTGENIVHSSDSAASAAREISYWFEKSEVTSYPPYSHVRA